MTARLAIILALLAALAAGAIWFFRQGGESVRVSIERQNNASGDKSDQARANYDNCLDRGGVYDFATGDCKRAAPRRRN